MEMLGNAGTFFDFRGAGRSLTKNSYGCKKYIFGQVDSGTGETSLESAGRLLFLVMLG